MAGVSLFPNAGKTPGRTPRSGRIGGCLPRPEPALALFPCIFPADQGIRPRDWFALACFLRHPVCVRGDRAPGARAGGEILARSRGFERGVRAEADRRAPDGGPAALFPRIVSAAELGGPVWGLGAPLGSARPAPSQIPVRDTISLKLEPLVAKRHSIADSRKSCQLLAARGRAIVALSPETPPARPSVPLRGAPAEARPEARRAGAPSRRGSR